jgi:hypothetical protein
MNMGRRHAEAAKTTESVLATRCGTTSPATRPAVSARVERACESDRGCTSAARDPRRSAGRCTRADNRSEGRLDCGRGSRCS